jgi:hypothetical protein
MRLLMFGLAGEGGELDLVTIFCHVDDHEHIIDR